MRDVVVIGGGPVGLVTGYALHKVGLDVLVCERVTEMTPRGAGLTILSNGVDCLKAIDEPLYQAIEQRSSDDKGFKFVNIETGFQKETPAVTGRKVNTSWYHFQNTVAQLLPPGILQLGKSYVGHTQQQDTHLSVTFADGTEMSTKLLVGCDGYRSPVRSASLEDGPSDFSGNIIWRAWVDAYPDELEHNRDYFCTFVGSGDRSFVVRPICDGGHTWALAMPLETAEQLGVHCQPEKGLGGESRQQGELLVQQALQTLEGFPEEVKRLVGLATRLESVIFHGMYHRTVAAGSLRPWGKGRVTLAGDAAHAMLPVLGQGLNQGIEDAYCLARCCAQHGANEEALRAYEAARFDRVAAICDASGRREFSWLSEGQRTAEQQEEIKALHSRIAGEQFQPLAAAPTQPAHAAHLPSAL